MGAKFEKLPTASDDVTDDKFIIIICVFLNYEFTYKNHMQKGTKFQKSLLIFQPNRIMRIMSRVISLWNEINVFELPFFFSPKNSVRQ